MEFGRREAERIGVLDADECPLLAVSGHSRVETSAPGWEYQIRYLSDDSTRVGNISTLHTVEQVAFEGTRAVVAVLGRLASSN